MAYPEWFTAPPLVGGPNQYQVVEAASAASAAKLTAEGYKGPYATQAAAQAAADAQTKEATSTEVSTGTLLGTLAGFLGVGSISGTNLVIRAAKVIIGGVLLIIGLVHITGADNAVASAARKVPLPI